MVEKMQKYKTAAVIDIGSSVVRMNISQWNGESISELDVLEKPTQIGKEVFSSGNISSDTARVLSETLSGFYEKAREYGITSVNTIATTAMREAANQPYVSDYISTRNKLSVRVLEDVEAGALLISALKNSSPAESGETLIVHGGTGTIDFELLKNNTTILTHSIHTGLLKISEMLREASDFSRYTEIMAEEYLDTFLSRENCMRELLNADSIVFGTSDLLALSKLFKAKSNKVIKIKSKKLLEIYDSYRSLSIAQICRNLSINTSQSENLYSVLVLLSALLRYTKADEIIAAQVTHGEAMLDSVLRTSTRKSYNDGLYSGALSSAFDLASRYNCDIKHSEYVSSAAIEMFKALKKILGFDKKQSLLLHVACILHESGHYTNSKDSRKAAFHLIRDAHVYGLCSYETLLTANIVSPRSLPGESSKKLRGGILTQEESLFVAKMHALSRIADSLDYSHKQKAQITGVKLDNENLLIELQIREDYTLEQWVFNQRIPLFREIFGITPKLIIDNIYD